MTIYGFKLSIKTIAVAAGKAFFFSVSIQAGMILALTIWGQP
jgi:hypothetical protein